MKKPFIWDNYSDQPQQLKDKVYKKNMRQKEIKSLLKTISLSSILLPLSMIAMPFIRRRVINSDKFFSMGVDFSKHRKETNEFLDELEIKNILVRFKLWEMDKLEELVEFLSSHNDKHITLKILQDREHIEDLELLKKNLNTIFYKLNQYIDIFEIGSTINRAKWGFFSVNEYLNFYKVAYDLKKDKFQNINIIGSGVIDFEFHFTIHTLFNLCRCKFDGVSSLLYVDRRGAPENTQLGFTLLDKIALLSTMVWISPKTKQKLYITETNWPISGTAPYAPTSEYECVSEDKYCDFMVRYHLLAFASQQVDSISWHQLIATGYGLINEKENLKKREAFFAYKFMVKNLKNAQFLRMDIKRDYYILQALVDNQLLQIHWSLKTQMIKNEDFFIAYDIFGNRLKDEQIKIGSRVVYIYIKED